MGRSSTSSGLSVKLAQGKAHQVLELLGIDVKSMLKEGVEAFLADGKTMLLEALMHAEAEQKCGRWHAPDKDRACFRWGYEKGTAKIDGGKTTVRRPRVRLLRNLGEVQLETYTAMNRNELLDGPLTAAIMAGVSKRRYASILTKGLELSGVSRSSISRKAIAATKSQVDDFLKRRIESINPIVLLFDGIHIAKRQVIVCIGIDGSGRKHVLAIKNGATENEIVCRDLINDLRERGLKADQPYLFVIDGSKALAAAIRAAFGQEAAIQRCQEHKIRDVQAYVPYKMRAEIRDKMYAAYNEKSEKSALDRLTKIRTELCFVSEAAMNSLTEGMYETLTVNRLGITGWLRASLRTTNIIESMFSSVRRYMGRVTHMQDEKQTERWLVRSLIEAEKHFRTVKGTRQIGKLRQKLEKFDPRTPNS